MITIYNEYEIGDSVYLRTDPDQFECLITGITIKAGGTLTYEIACGSTVTWHYGFELSHDKRVF